MHLKTSFLYVSHILNYRKIKCAFANITTYEETAQLAPSANRMD
ncbi:hypothetical protein CHCC14596_4338 [Bacillus licheniformis]|nr:hypothetical protein CHCC14596_4338 [Bacillus licheniformis]